MSSRGKKKRMRKQRPITDICDAALLGAGTSEFVKVADAFMDTNDELMERLAKR